MIDGTFRVTPYPFTQLLIISAFDNQSKMNIPVSYILINSKSENAYFNALNKIFDQMHQIYTKMDSNNTEFQPKVNYIVVDLEKGLMNAIKRIFKVQIKADKFHFIRKNFVKGVELGLSTKEYKFILWGIVKKLSSLHYLDSKEEFIQS